ncbi:MAG: hypothetical protein ACI4NJ_04970 [Cellvibrio sp.]
MSSHRSDKNLSAIQAKAWVAVCVLPYCLFTSSVSAETPVEPTKPAAVENKAASASTPASKNRLTRLSTVYVEATDLSNRVSTLQSEGAYRLDTKALENLGNTSGSMTDALSTIANIQYSDQVDPSSTLKPSSISIAGGRFYENNFSINGMSNNSQLDPAGQNESSINDVPGHEQAIFFDLDQLESISVYDSNVPVEYGNFTGGVVDARLKFPGANPKTTLSAFTTDSDWVDYHLILREEDQENATFDGPVKPEFSRTRYTLSHERQLTENHGIRFGVNHQTLTTPMLSLLRSEDVDETSSSFSLTHGYKADNGVKLLTYLGYSPYEKQTLLENVKDSRYELTGGGLSLNSELTLPINNQIHTVNLSINQSEESRRAPTDLREWKNTQSKHWGIEGGYYQSAEGGHGDLDKEQLRINLQWKTQHSLNSQWSLKYGAQLAYSESGFDRPVDVSIYDNAVTNTQIQCIGREYDCVQKEQYFRDRKIYPADKVTVDLTETALFGELRYQRERLDLTLGARIDQDNFLNNTNIVWRSRAVYSLNNEGSYALVGGVNRYYGGPLLTYKLREAAKPYYSEYRGSYQNVIRDWEYNTDAGVTKYRFDKVNTPYSDELTLGLRGNFGKGVAEIKWLQRKNRDEFSRTIQGPEDDGYLYYLMNNDGYSNYDSFVASWDGTLGRFDVGANITWSKTESSNDTYDDVIDSATDSQLVWYKGAAHTLTSLNQERTNFARPLVGNIYVSSELAFGIKGTVKLKYKGDHTTITRGRGVHYTGNVINVDGASYEEALPNYIDRDISSNVIVDAKFQWKPTDNSPVNFTLEVLNLFDQRTYALNGLNRSGIEVGRSFWVGTQLQF